MLFKFFNNVGIVSSICDVYFDDGTLLNLATISASGSGVKFSQYADPGELPGANLVSPPFVTSVGFSLDSDSKQGGVMGNGVDSATEWLGVAFTLKSGQTYADTLAALNDGSLRIGLHVQSIGTKGGSDSYVNVVPVPGAVLLGLLGLGYSGMKLRRKCA